MTGPNSVPTRAVPWRWNMNSPIRTTSVIGTTYGVKPGRGDLEALDRAEHRDRRRDDAVAEEERGAEDARARAAAGAAAPVADRLRGEREHRDQAALAVVVGAQDEDART